MAEPAGQGAAVADILDKYHPEYLWGGEWNNINGCDRRDDAIPIFR